MTTLGSARHPLPHLTPPQPQSQPHDNEGSLPSLQLDEHLKFYKGIVEKLDSAIFVVGGPNRVSTPLNTKAENFFAEFLEDASQDSRQEELLEEIFEKIIISDYSKNCVDYLHTLGL